jgi:hypothetical protein
MDTRLGLLVAMLLAAGSDVPRARAQSPRGDSVWRALPCVGTAETYRDGQLRLCTLASDSRLGVFKLPAGSVVSLAPGPRLVNVRLSRETSFYGQPLPANTTMIFFGDGTLRSFWLATDMVIQGHLLAAQHDGIGHMLHPTGKLRAVGLARDEVIDGVPCTSRRNPFQLGLGALINGDNAAVLFYPDGRLRQCRVARTATVDGHTLQRGQVIRLRPDGTWNPGADAR